MQTTTRLATEKQFSFLVQLVNERPGAKTYVDTQLAANGVSHPRELSVSEMSNVIGVVLDMPKTSKKPETSEEPEAGVYRRNDGELFRVYFGQQSGHMLAKHIRFLEGEVDYMYSGAARLVVKNAVRLSLEEVGQLGVASGSCLVCGRRLDDPESVDRGIGPVCAAKY
jgi:hypothetical protein